MEYWAHSARADSGGPSAPHLLADHLRAVAKLSAQFAAEFGCGAWAHLAGLWHDLGKYRPGFQRYIHRTYDPDAHIEHTADHAKTHSTAGALHALDTLGQNLGRVLAFLIAGHHAGLPDWEPSDGGGTSLQARMAAGEYEYAQAKAEAIPADILTGTAPAIDAAARAGFALWLRMLFSCLVDADFLDTEGYFSPDKAAQRRHYPELREMKAALDSHLAHLSRTSGTSPLNGKREEVLTACRERAALPPGFFTLTVPTGGGKTLSSLAFALEHALIHDKRRVVYAIPYTSIIEQTAEVFRAVFHALEKDVVVEHHSNFDIDPAKENHANRLASENWDAPLIVTTNVQLFESLHAARTSRCRKLHNLANSVIILDEAQMLPRDFLAPVLQSLKLLVEHYGVTIVLCTATQPMLASRHQPVTRRKLLDGIDDARQIIAPEPLFKELRRVDIHLPTDFRVPISWDELAPRIAAHDCVLAIVNTRRDARELFGHMPQEGAIHLSALMCAEHRSRVIATVRRRLKAKRENADNLPLRVISTQLVEAGVDLDFPVVYRALAGMDSIAQAAGRCNREGRLDGFGQVHVFVPPHPAPPGLLRQGEQITRELADSGQLADPLAPATFRAYFDRLYAQDDHHFDREDILMLQKPERSALRTAAARFRLIDDDSESVIVPYHPEDGANEQSPVHAWLAALAKDGNTTWARRKLQRFTVNVPRRDFEQMLREGNVEEKAGLWLAYSGCYGTQFGLAQTRQKLPDRELII